MKTPSATPADVKQLYGMPTPEQLAHLAATLAGHTHLDLMQSGDLAQSGDPKLKLLVSAALHLWKAAEAVHLEESESYSTPDVNVAVVATEKAVLARIPIMTLDEFLHGALPNARLEDKARAWKHYNLVLADIDPLTATTDQNNAAATAWRSPEYLGDLIFCEDMFQTWWNKYHAAEVSKVRSEIRLKTIELRAGAKAIAKQKAEAKAIAKKKAEAKEMPATEKPR